jgi:hypothetical protein
MCTSSHHNKRPAAKPTSAQQQSHHNKRPAAKPPSDWKLSRIAVELYDTSPQPMKGYPPSASSGCQSPLRNLAFLTIFLVAWHNGISVEHHNYQASQLQGITIAGHQCRASQLSSITIAEHHNIKHSSPVGARPSTNREASTQQEASSMLYSQQTGHSTPCGD